MPQTEKDRFWCDPDIEYRKDIHRDEDAAIQEAKEYAAEHGTAVTIWRLVPYATVEVEAKVTRL